MRAMTKVKRFTEQNSQTIAIYSIGYQGLSIDDFIDILAKKGIKKAIWFWVRV